MLTLSQIHMEATGTLGLVIGILLLTSTIVLSVWKVWQWVLGPILRRCWAWWNGKTPVKDIAFLKFRTEWMADKMTVPSFILDADRKCVFANEALLKLYQIDSTEILGRAWHRLVKESELTETLRKWDEAYALQSNYTNVTTIRVGGRGERRFKIEAEPYIWRGNVRAFLGTVTPFDIIEK